MNTDEQDQSRVKAPMQNALVALCAVATFLIISWLIRFSTYGIDFTDESFYLIWIAYPFLYDGSVTQFGFLYHPLYKLLGGDIAALRQANILITFALAWGLVYFFLGSLSIDSKKSRIMVPVVSASLATSAYILFDSWLPTPSYNSLNLQALLIAATGLVLAEKDTGRKSITGWLLFGVGVWLAFMAKPSTALALAVGASIYLLLARKLSMRMLALTAISVLALLSISAMLIDGSLAGFVNRLLLGIEFSKHLGGGHTLSQLLRIDDFQLSARLKLSILLVAGTVFLALWSMCAKNKKWQVIGLLISINFFSITALLTLGQFHQAAGFGRFQGLLIFAVVYAAVIAALVLGRLRALKSVSSEQWMIAALFLAMPHFYAFGTNGNYWQSASSAAIFWLLAGLTLLGPMIRDRDSWLLLLPFALAAQSVTATLIQTGLEEPYRQPQPLRLNSFNLEIGPQSSALTIPEGYSTYISSVMVVAKKAGFEARTPLIDLSGQSPGILFALNAYSIGHPWTLGGYPGSPAFLKAGLSRSTCEELSGSWVLYEPDGPRKIPAEIMHELGANFPEDYERVAKWHSARGAGGYPLPRVQELYKPVARQKVLNRCQKLH